MTCECIRHGELYCGSLTKEGHAAGGVGTMGASVGHDAGAPISNGGSTRA